MCSIGNSGNGIGIDFCLHKITRQRYSPRQYWVTGDMGCSEQTHPRASHNWPDIACLSCIQNKMDLLWGLGSVLFLENVRAKAQGPMGLRSYPVYIYTHTHIHGRKCISYVSKLNLPKLESYVIFFFFFNSIFNFLLNLNLVKSCFTWNPSLLKSNFQ